MANRLKPHDKQAVLVILAAQYHGRGSGLDYRNPFELLIAVMLSAQSTDKMVNVVTGPLFAAYPDAATIAKLTPADLKPWIAKIGLTNTKAKNVVATSQILHEKYDGQVPNDLEALVALPGVGRKTANVVLSNVFGVPAIPVDTHVFRVSNRIGLADATTVEATEKDLQAAIPKKDWSAAHHWLIWHGREVCKAQKPDCAGCQLAVHCLYNQAQVKAQGKPIIGAAPKAAKAKAAKKPGAATRKTGAAQTHVAQTGAAQIRLAVALALVLALPLFSGGRAAAAASPVQPAWQAQVAQAPVLAPGVPYYPGDAPPLPGMVPLRDPEARLDAVTGSLVLAPANGAVPTISESNNPPRIMAEWKGTGNTVPRSLNFNGGPITKFQVEKLGERTRVTLFMKDTPDGNWSVGYANGKTIVRLMFRDVGSNVARPLAARTPRPAPRLPQVRITPYPMVELEPPARPLPGMVPPRPLPPLTYVPYDARLPVPDPFPQGGPSAVSPVLPAATPPPLTLSATPVPIPLGQPLPTAVPSAAPETPVFTPSPDVAVVEAEAPLGPDRAVFGSQVALGADIGINQSETYPLGKSAATLPWTLGGSLAWDHMFSENVGLVLNGGSTGYVIDDEAATAAGFQVLHKRDDYHLGAGFRYRQPFGYGLEGMLQPGLMLRYVNATTTNAALTAGAPGPAVGVNTSDYLTADWLSYGGAIRAGLGWRLARPFALLGFGEYRYLFAGNMLTQGVAPFFPITGWRAGAEAKLELEHFGFSLGYVHGADNHTGTTATDTWDQGGGTAYAKFLLLY